MQLHICSLRHFIALHFLLICPTDHFCTAAKLFFIGGKNWTKIWQKLNKNLTKFGRPLAIQCSGDHEIKLSKVSQLIITENVRSMQKSADLQDFILLQNPLLFLPQQHASRRGGRLPVTFYLFSKPKFNLPSTQPQKILQTQCLICANQCNKRSTDQTNQTKDQPTKQKIDRPNQPNIQSKQEIFTNKLALWSFCTP